MSQGGLQECEIIEVHGVWAKYVKPRPESMDVWTHQSHDPSGNPVSTDEMGMPNGLRWIAGPNWPNGYRKSGTKARVISEKHLIYIFRDTVLPGVPEQWSLTVRDAYNGLLLWKRKLESQSPTLVSAGDRIIISLDQDPWGGGGGIIALDADTGRLVHTYEHAKGCRSVFHIDGKLVVHVPEGLRCLDVGSGKIVWSIPNTPGSEIRGFKAANGSIFLHLRSRGQDGQTVHIFNCLDLATGRELWTNNSDSWCDAGLTLLFSQYDVLVANADGATHGISAKDGSHLWSHQTRYGALAAAGLIWALNEQDAASPGWEGLDPRTGKIVKRVSKWTERRPYHWIRCCGNTATPNFIICGGFDYADFKTGEIKLFNAAKNGCTTAGVVPANGMAYTFSNACWCRNWLRGFLACAATKVPDVAAATNQAGRLQRGPAYGASTIGSTQSTQEWPTYRHDTGRSAATTAAGPQRLDVRWQKQVTSPAPASLARQWDVKDDGGRTTAPVVAHGLVFVAASDRHSLTAFDAKTGAPRWNFIAGGRIDCPPTIYEGLCLFGSRDGWIYCVTAKDGSLAWRYRAAPQESKIVAYGQLESVWPVVGGVLVHDGLAYFTAGRHSDIDGGVVVGAVEPETGKPVWMQHAEGLGGTPDVLVGGDGAIEMGSLAFDAKDGHKIDTRARFRAGRLGLRNDAWNKNPIALRKNSNVWTVDREKTGQMLAFNKSVTVGFRTGFNHINDNLARSFSGYASLFAIPEKNESAQADQLLKEWLIDMHPEARVRGMVLTPERLFVAGRLYHTNPIENPASYDTGNGNFTVAVLFQISEKHWTGTNLVSKAPLLGGLNSGGKEIFFKDNRIHYSIDGLGILTSENEVSYGKWHQVVVTDHSGEVRLYIDGKLEGKKEQFTQPDVKGHVLKVEDRRRIQEAQWRDQ